MYFVEYPFRYLPTSAVSYPTPSRAVASVTRSSNEANPPCGGSFL
jgi:hypothetical protein